MSWPGVGDGGEIIMSLKTATMPMYLILYTIDFVHASSLQNRYVLRFSAI